MFKPLSLFNLKAILYMANMTTIAQPSQSLTSQQKFYKLSISIVSVQMVNQDAYLPVKTNPLSSNMADNQACMYEPAIAITRPQFDIGDIVWAQAHGLPSWPGKVVDASEVGKQRPDDGKVGDTYSSAVTLTFSIFWCR